MCSLYIAFTVNPATDDMLEAIDGEWGTEGSRDTIRSIQWQFECCGWENVSDRALPVCPDNFESGCKQTATEYLTPRYKEILVSTIVEFCAFAVSMGVLSACVCLHDDSTAAERIFGLSDMI
jgi:hypothetical protein